MCVCVRACVRAVHSGDQLDDLQNYVRTMGSHSMRKYFLTFRTLYFMLHFVMVIDSVYIFGYATITFKNQCLWCHLSV